MRANRMTAAVLAVFMLFSFSSCSVLLPSYAAKQDAEKYFKYENVETDTGKIYENISYTQVRENKKHPENKGISLFVVRLPSDNEKGFEEKIVGGFITYTD